MRQSFARSKLVLFGTLVCALFAMAIGHSFYAHYRKTSYCGRQGLGITCLARRLTHPDDHADWIFQPFTSSNGEKRTYLLLQPARPGLRPTIVVLHGVKGNGVEAAVGSSLGSFAPEHGFVGVFPNALNGLWNAFPPGKAPASVKRRAGTGGLGDDVLFLRELIADLVRRGISDPKRIYMTGLSMGGFMALEFACTNAADVAGVALLSSSMPDVTGDACSPSRPLPLLMMNGTADRSVPYLGGFLVGPQYDVWSTERTLAFFRTLDGCRDPPKTIELPRLQPEQATRVTLVEWNECRAGRVGLYKVEGGEHEFPPIGIDTPATLLAFFNASL